MSTTKFFVGCSSFATASWKSVFYPDDLPKKDWFAYYCKYFNTYEFNGSFYRFPTVESLKKWYDKTPNGFMFSIKVPKAITHTKKLLDCEQEIAEFYSVIAEGLSDKLGCVLWQFPPGFLYSEEQILAKNYNEVCVYFNNTASTAAVINAIQFNKMREQVSS